MSDPHQPDWSDPTQAAPMAYPPNPDPAYAKPDPAYAVPPYTGSWGPANPGPGYHPGYGAPMNQPTEQFPTYWQAGPGYPPPPPPPKKKSPRWLWIAAAAAVLLVSGLVLALVVVTSSSRNSTMVAPATQTTSAAPTTRPSPTTPAATTPRAPIPTVSRPPLPPVAEEPVPTDSEQPTSPGETTTDPSRTEPVTYTVTGEGRAINITYVDTGGVMQTEFNVVLPWSREVSLSAPAKTSASVAVLNVGRDVTCSISVSGAQVRQRTGRGLTICTGAA